MWDFVERSGKQSREGVRNDIRRAEAASELYPRFGSAMRAGTISADHLDVLRSLLTTPQLKEAATAGESFLLEQLQNISQPRDLKRLNSAQIQQLCGEIRQFLLDSVS